MRRISIVVLVMLVFASPAFAQENPGTETRGFFFVAPGTFTGYSGDPVMLRFGGGVETVARSGLGFAFDAGWLTSSEGMDYGMGSFSGAVMYEFPVNGRVKPYVRGGAGIVANRSGGEPFWNFGGGINYWFRDSTGLKVEVRDTLQDTNLRYGLLEVMVGLIVKF